jgi:tetratricopeptide (TPR) repeat protein
LQSLPPDLAETVGAHLLLAGESVDTDPEAAYAHAQAARRRASRMAIVREATAETAYAAGRYDTALAEYRALRRMTGVADYLPVMADCQRALGKTDAALQALREADEQALSASGVIELRIVEAGIRADLGQAGEAARLLQTTISQVETQVSGKRVNAKRSPRSASPAKPDPARHSGQRPAAAGDLDTAMTRLHYALGDALLSDQQTDRARTEFARAAESDINDVTDAAERLDELEGLVIEFDDSPAMPAEQRPALPAERRPAMPEQHDDGGSDDDRDR